MECKNCHYKQPNPFNYCPECGARVIKNRLTVKNLTADILRSTFDIDSTILKTFRHLFSKPEVVVDSYVQGIRKKYVNPIGYFGVAITLSGLLLFLMRKFFRGGIDYDVWDQGVNQEAMGKVMNILFDLNTLLFIVYIPIFALAGWFIFNKKDYNPTEYHVFSMYILAHWSIITFPVSVLTLLISPQSYLILGIPMLFVLIAYAIYAMQRLNKFSIGQLILRSPVYTLLVTLGYFGIILVFYAILFLTGIISLTDFAPVK